MKRIDYRDYWTEVAELAKSITAEAREHDREIGDVLHETIDGHEWVIYTYMAQQVLVHSPNDGYAVEEFGIDAVIQDGSLNWSALAFGAMYADVSEHSDFAADDEL